LSASQYYGDAAKNRWSDNTVVEDGVEYVVRMYVHNNAASNLELVAKNVRAYIVLPTASDKSITVSGQLFSSNANPPSIWDQTTFVSANGVEFCLSYVDGSAMYHNAKDGEVRTFNLDELNDDYDIFTTKGVLLGYDQMDGDIPGCNEYSGYLTFLVVAHFAKEPY